MDDKKIDSIKDAQEFVKQFAVRNGWSDEPNIDKFDHLHEELVEMSRLLRYKNLEERKETLTEKHEELKDGIGDIFFALCRLSNQLNVDIEEAFNMVKNQIAERYKNGAEGSNR
jgi:NTP pyrophosphatase (non-canonical NTP hydrolase)